MLGFYFYHYDTQQTDIELRTSYLGYAWWTNQPSVIYNSTVAKSSTSYHEYRLDRIAGKLIFYIDEVQKKTLDRYSPTLTRQRNWSRWS